MPVQRHTSQAADSEKRFATIFHHSPVALLITTIDGGEMLDMNDAFCELVGYARHELLGKTTIGLGLWRSAQERQAIIARFQQDGRVRDADVTIHDASGNEHLVKLSLEAIVQDGRHCFISTALDVTLSRRAEVALAESEDRFRHVTAMTSDLFYACKRTEDGYFRIEWLGGDAQRVFGCTREELERLGCWRDFAYPEDRPLFDASITNLQPGQSSDVIMRAVHRDGSLRYVRSYAQVFDAKAGADTHQLYGALQDVTERMRLEQQLEYHANHDSLTGLVNRRQFLILAQQEMTRARRYGSPMSIAMLDLDHFKAVNDTYGHEVGDRVLRQFADIARGILREVDIMGRLGGEEFAVFFPETSGANALEVAERLREAIANAAISLEHGLPIRISVSIGITPFLTTDKNIDMLLSRADQALYEAKRSGRNRTCALFID
ncbi:MAG: diguanylate cyclase [Hydrogenophilales bacterium]|nr:diguanylate cyclase [Hydrogenophilales bacterium]